MTSTTVTPAEIQAKVAELKDKGMGEAEAYGRARKIRFARHVHPETYSARDPLGYQAAAVHTSWSDCDDTMCTWSCAKDLPREEARRQAAEVTKAVAAAEAVETPARRTRSSRRREFSAEDAMVALSTAPAAAEVTPEPLILDGLPAGSRGYFVDLASDAGNWSGQPWFDGNLGRGRSTSGFVGRLVKAGLVISGSDGSDAYAIFTPLGVQAAAQVGIDLTGYYPEVEGVTVAAAPVAPVAPVTDLAAHKAKKGPAAKAAPAGRPTETDKPLWTEGAHAGYQLAWHRAKYDMLKNLGDVTEDRPLWVVICEHGTVHVTKPQTGGASEIAGRQRATWCKSCKKAASA